MSSFSILRKKIQAFSLIEMSLVLAIMGTIAGLSLPMLLEQKNIQNRQKTKNNIELVLSATGTYAATHSRLPCPALSTSNGVSSACGKTTLDLANGYVPYKILGISEASSKDGFGHPLRFVIDPSLTHHDDFYKNDNKQLSVKTSKGNDVLNGCNEKDRLAVVIISEGEAYKNPIGSFEQKNIDRTLAFSQAPYSSNKDNPFRHLVVWSPRNLLITYYGKAALPNKMTEQITTREQPARVVERHHVDPLIIDDEDPSI